MTSQESKAINSVRFICIIFLVLLHTRVDHLVCTTITEPVNKVQELVNIPFLNILFVLSGYLFFYSRKPLQQGENWFKAIGIDKIAKRLHTLLIPYIIWCMIAIVYNHFVKHISWPNGVTDFLIQFWDANDGHPIGKAMWYIKSLIIFSLFSPLYYYVVKWLKHFVLPLTLILAGFNIPIDYPYFNLYLLLGAYVAIMGFSFSDILNRFDWRLCLMFYLLLKGLLFFDVLPFKPAMPMAFLCFIALFGLMMKYNVHPTLTVSSSFIYFAHPYVTGVRNLYIKLVDNSTLLPSLTTWVLTATTVIIICYATYRFMKRFTPKILSIITGDRT